MNEAPNQRHWLFTFVSLATIWGSSFWLLGMASAELGPWTTAWLRVSLAGLILLPLVLWRGQGALLLRHARTLMVVGLLNSGLPFALYGYALMQMSTGLAAILNSLAPLFGALVGWLWFKDPLSRWRFAGLLLGFAGAALLALNAPGGVSLRPGGSGWAVLACLGATLSYGISGNITQRQLKTMPPMVIAAGTQLGAAILLATPGLMLWPEHNAGLSAWLALGAVSLFCTSVAYILFFGLIQRMGSNAAMTVTYVTPVFATTLGVVALGETFSMAMLGCAAIILLGTALATGLLGPRRS
ncbi:MAG: DMT family transporter [Alphaproteobacteria bacterium]|nr:DMT family transporter [Alphaproteobacteria bacterium]